MPHLYAHYLLVTHPPFTILTWLLESRRLFTNTCSFLAVTWTSWVPSTSPLLIYSSAWLVPCHAFVMLTHAQLAVVTQSCTLLYIAVHCDLLLQWRYCSSDAYCSHYFIVLLQYISQACWVLWSPRLDFFHRTVISTLVAANRLRSPLPLCLIPLKVIHCNVPKWQALVNYFSSETI